MFHHQLSPKELFISLSGLIGAGKTTLAKALGQKLGLPVYYEQVDDNDLLPEFYRDMKEYGLILQFDLLNRRFQQQQEIVWKGKGAVQDRSIYEDSIFVNMLVKAGKFNDKGARVYRKTFETMAKMMTHPTCIIHLDVSPEKALERIRSRARGMESKITLEYLQGLHEAYQEFLQQISVTIPVIRINWEEFNENIDQVTDRIIREINSINRIHVINMIEETPVSTKPESKLRILASENKITTIILPRGSIAQLLE